MFTGIITNLGKVKSKSKNTFTVACGKEIVKKLSKGDSISVNGICLTVVKTGEDYFVIDFMKETADKTNIKYLKVGDLVNLEFSATPISFLSGHIIMGHVDGLGKLMEIKVEGNSRILRISFPFKLSGYFTDKGSVCINGISLTIINIYKNFFTVGIIPHTWKNTMLHTLNPGDFVNIEVDVLAKYIERILNEKNK